MRGWFRDKATGKHTLWLLESPLINTSLQGSVEKSVEHGVGDVNGIVGLDVLLEGWTAVQLLA